MTSINWLGASRRSFLQGTGAAAVAVSFGGASALGAGEAMLRLQNAVNERNAADQDVAPLALSIGLANWSPSSDETLEELMQRADRKMYAHKRSKRQ